VDFLAFSDLHLQEKLEYGEREGQNIFSWIAFNCLDQIFKYAVDYKIEDIFFLGDLFHSRSKVQVRLISKLIDIFTNWNLYGIKIYLIKGTSSHDGDGEDYIGYLFKSLENVIILDNPCSFRFGKQYVIYVIPSLDKDRMIWEISRFSDEISERKKILFIHGSVEGAKVMDYEVTDLNSIAVDKFTSFHYVLAGHYHCHQKIGNNVYYVGSPYRVSFAEKDDVKGFIHFKNGKVSFISLQVPNMLEICLPASNYKDISYNFTDSFVKIIIEGSELECKNVDDMYIRKEVIKRGALGVKIEYVIQNDKEQVKQARMSKDMPISTMVEKYLDCIKSELGGLDVKKLKEVALSILQEASGGKNGL